MFALVSIDGRYHGHVDSAKEAKELEHVQKNGPVTYRLLPESDWKKVEGLSSEERKGLFASGQPL